MEAIRRALPIIMVCAALAIATALGTQIQDRTGENPGKISPHERHQTLG